MTPFQVFQYVLAFGAALFVCYLLGLIGYILLGWVNGLVRE